MSGYAFHPEVVLRAGLPGYTGNLPAVSDDDVGALGSWLESTIVGMEEIDFHALDPAAQLIWNSCLGPAGMSTSRF